MVNLVTVEGEYVTRVDDIAETLDYKEQFAFDESVKTEGEARAIAKRLVKTRLLKHDKNVKFIHTCAVTNIKPTDKKAEQAELVSLWLSAITLGCIPDTIEQYRDEKGKIAALKRAIEKIKARRAKPKPNGNASEGWPGD